MKLCAAQTKPVKGNIESNIINHKRLINLAVSEKADMIIFPELSITGYEPALAKELATDINDRRFDVFQNISDDHKITIGIGIPLKNNGGVSISMIIFQPNRSIEVYSKKYLHADEEPHFVSGDTSIGLLKGDIGFAICYEVSVAEHAANAFNAGAKNYVASVAKSVKGVEKAFEHLSGIAGRYSMMALMSNCIGHCDNFECGGKSAAWDDTGSLIAQLNNSNEGVLIVDTVSRAVVMKMI